MSPNLDAIKASARKLLDEKPNYGPQEWGDGFSQNEVEQLVKEAYEGWAEKVKAELDKLEAIEIILTLHYVEGDMTEKEALDEICHLVYPESRPSSEVKPE